jgi:pimeloyl-ACP methyl ester carboxylesterase
LQNSLPPPFPADQFFLTGASGEIAVYCAGNGSPVLLVHTVNAAASAAEVRPLFEELQKNHTVYAFDLPGYGLSDRRAIEYTIRIMTDSIKLVANWIRPRHPGQKILGIGTSLSCEFIARCAVEDISLFKALTLVSPTGFRGLKPYRGNSESSRYIPWLDKILRGPGWGGFLFRKLTTPSVIRYFLQRTWGSKNIDETLWQYDILTTRAPNAEFAPLSFLSAALFSADIHTIYEKLTLPVLVIHGTKGDFTDYRGLGIVINKQNWSLQVINGGALVYFEKQIEFFEALNYWLDNAVQNT